MKLKLKNICKIKEAELNFNGLTVLVGINSSGKSTIAKALFSAVKIGSTSEVREVNRLEHLRKSYDEFYLILKENTSNDHIFDFCLQDKLEQLVDEHVVDIDVVIDIFQQNIQANEDNTKSVINILKAFHVYIDKIRFYTPRGIIISRVQILIEEEFNKKIATNTMESCEIDLSENDNSVKWGLLDKKYFYKIKKGFINSVSDATYIVSSDVLDLLDLLTRTVSYDPLLSLKNDMLIPRVPTHIKDFANKIDTIRYNIKREDETLKKVLLNKKGEFKYNEEEKCLKYYPRVGDDKECYDIENVASGVKIFGILDILIKLGFVSKSNMLIWDEPENHLHPAWQVEFAALIVSLSKIGVPIVVSTHSPYFLQAIRYYAQQDNLDANKLNYYYLTENENNLSEVVNVNDDLDKVFSILAAPLNKIINI